MGPSPLSILGLFGFPNKALSGETTAGSRQLVLSGCSKAMIQMNITETAKRYESNPAVQTKAIPLSNSRSSGS